MSISTSLGYEALSRGKRVAYLNICHSVHPMKLGINYRYGWPNKFPRKGPFWAYSFKKKEIWRVLNFITKVDNRTWKKLQKKYVDPIIIYDYGNKKLKRIFKKIGMNS